LNIYIVLLLHDDIIDDCVLTAVLLTNISSHASI
jgi:hypothetical protein